MADHHWLQPAPAPTPPRASSERAGDSDRDSVVTALRDHLVAGRLTLDEFSERTGVALTARTKAELEAVLADVPTESGELVGWHEGALEG